MNCDFCKLEVDPSDLVNSEEILIVDPMDSNNRIQLHPAFSGHSACMEKFESSRQGL